MKLSIYTLIFIMISMYSCDQEQSAQSLPSDPIDRAIALLTDSIAESPKNARLYYERAQNYRKKGAMELALNDFYKCNQYDSTNSKYYATIAEFLLENGNGDRAIMSIESAIKYDPQNPIYHFLAGKYNLYLKRYQPTLDHLNNALKIDPTFAEAYFHKGYAYKEIGNFDKALSNFLTATEQNPMWDEPYEMIGVLYAEKKDKRCIQYFDNAIKINSHNSSAMLSKAYFYKSINQIDSALINYERIVTSFPQNVDAIYSIGIINYERQKYDLALKQFEICTKVDPAWAQGYFMMGQTYLKKGEKQKAKSMYHQTLVLDPKHPDAQAAINRLGGLNPKSNS